ncbi:MAG TPA: hypothetical protein VFB02_13075 [Bradyrhizobium sp.]|jgi:hypothetical protein|nr:hypothetical protein [Bradyrhizobium sp.]
MGNRTFKIATSGLLALAIGALVTATPAASQSLTDRFKSLFGGKSDEQQPPIVDNKEPVPDINCPPVGIRAGASTYAVAAPGKEAVGNDVRFQATISRTARECVKAGGDITARIGIQGRVIVGPAGAPASVEVPLRVAVVLGGVTEKVIATKAYRTNVEIGEQDSVPFSLVVDDLVFPEPSGADIDKYIFYIGFDPQALAPEPKAKAGKKRK